MEQTTERLAIPSAGRGAGDACRACGAAMARDQRYCLECGTRRGDARVPLTALWPAEAPPAAVAGPAERRPERPAMTTTLTAIAAAAVVLALVAGLLIGRGERPAANNASAPAPKITVVGGGSGTADTAAAAAGSAATVKRVKRHVKKAKAASAVGNAPKASLTSKGQKVGTADKSTLKALQNTSGKDYSKKSANLPTTTVLPGKPPPKDNKPAGGGSKSVEIG